MKMAKPSEEDFNIVHDFLQGIELAIEEGCLPDPSNPDGCGEDATPERFLDWVERQWRLVRMSWSRVLWAGKTAIDNACDPNSDVLEFRPDILAAMAAFSPPRARLHRRRDFGERGRVMDLDKLSPAPWQESKGEGIMDGAGDSVYEHNGRGSGTFTETDLAFILLSRNAFDVMMRLGWSVHRFGGQSPTPWFAVDENREQVSLPSQDEDGEEIWLYPKWAADPFTCLVEAHRWYLENKAAPPETETPR